MNTYKKSGVPTACDDLACRCYRAELAALREVLAEADEALLLVMICPEGTVSPGAIGAVNAAHERIADIR